MKNRSNTYNLVKFADDTALIGLMNENNISEYEDQIQTFVMYCKDNYLELNVAKTKELIVDFQKKINTT